MKKRFRKNARTRKRELVILPGKGESLNPKQSAWLKDRPHRTFLHFGFSYGRGVQDVVLYYDVDGLVSLKTYLKRTHLDETALARLLVDVALSQIWCSKGEGRYFSMLFDAKDIYVDADGHLSFVFVPFDGLTFRVENSPLMVLRTLSDVKHLKLEDHNARVLAGRLSEFVLNENEVFSLNSFREFIRSECWIDVSPEGRVKRVEGSTVGTSIETGPQGDVPTEVEVVDTEYRPIPSAAAQFTFIRVAKEERHNLQPNTTMMVGRGSDCQIRLLGNTKIGRRHLALQCAGEGLVLQDLGSANGTTVEDERLDPSYAVMVPYGTKFYVADEECMVQRVEN